VSSDEDADDVVAVDAAVVTTVGGAVVGSAELALGTVADGVVTLVGGVVSADFDDEQPTIEITVVAAKRTAASGVRALMSEPRRW
jgi:hypothetical protein